MTIEKARVAANFHVFVPAEDGRDKKVAYTAGMAVAAADLPEGQSLQDWVDKGLAKAVPTAGTGDEQAHEAGTAV
jgi:hypothetical protein